MFLDCSALHIGRQL